MCIRDRRGSGEQKEDGEEEEKKVGGRFRGGTIAAYTTVSLGKCLKQRNPRNRSEQLSEVGSCLWITISFSSQE